MIGSFMKAYCS